MKKILSFTDYYWPGYKAGGTIRAFMNQVDYLKDNFEFYIVTSDTDYTESIPYPEIIPDRWNVISPNVNVFYVSAANHKIGLFNRLLNERKYDVVYIHLLFGFWFSFLPLLLAKIDRHKSIIIASHGVLGQGALGVKSFRKKSFLTLMKMIRFYHGTVFHSVIAHETSDIRAHIGENIKIAEARELPRKVSRPPIRKQKTAGKLTMVTVARISPEKNQLYALEILNQCRNYEIRYDIIGPVYDEAYWNECKEIIGAMPANVTVTYRGSIPSEKILEELQGFDVMLLPTTGENFGHTILESFMAGCPVIISDRTPWRDLEKSGIGMDIPLENPGRFKEAIDFFAALDQNAFATYSDNAFAYAKSYIANPEMLAENINLFNL
ncbi:MAG: glycosyltransferase family 4 protein [Bacteroidota bacterium]